MLQTQKRQSERVLPQHKEGGEEVKRRVEVPQEEDKMSTDLYGATVSSGLMLSWSLTGVCPGVMYPTAIHISHSVHNLNIIIIHSKKVINITCILCMYEHNCCKIEFHHYIYYTL